jgi:hypothetical protein
MRSGAGGELRRGTVWGEGGELCWCAAVGAGGELLWCTGAGAGRGLGSGAELCPGTGTGAGAGGDPAATGADAGRSSTVTPAAPMTNTSSSSAATGSGRSSRRFTPGTGADGAVCVAAGVSGVSGDGRCGALSGACREEWRGAVSLVAMTPMARAASPSVAKTVTFRRGTRPITRRPRTEAPRRPPSRRTLASIHLPTKVRRVLGSVSVHRRRCFREG